MTHAKLILVLGLALSVSACAAVDMPTRKAPFETLPQGMSDVQVPADHVALNSHSDLISPVYPVTPAPKQSRDAAPATEAALAMPVQPALLKQPLALTSRVTVDSVRVRVPRSLKVSEANRYLPRGDIVWREDPAGDRHEQVAQIMQSALEAGVAPLDGPVHVVLDVQVNRFHALTQKARYTTGGIHSISFDMVLTDPKTGTQLTDIRTVEADFKAYGGKDAIKAEARGETQKVRISKYLAGVIQQELTTAEGYKNARMGLIQMMNHF